MEREGFNHESVSRTIPQKNSICGTYMVDNRSDKNQNNLSDSPLQRISDEEEETLQGKFDIPVQRVEDEDDTLQGKFDGTLQKKNETGMPDNLKSGIENLSGFSMDDVRVHYNSSKPATIQALAYTQGTDIHVAPGQEKHLPHEVWHVAQQMAGRVSPTKTINGMAINDNKALEHEADVMGENAAQYKNTPYQVVNLKMGTNAVQCLAIKYGERSPIPQDAKEIADKQNVIRGKVIPVQNLKSIDIGCYKDVSNLEPIYIVSHGCCAIGNKPAHLCGDNGNELFGEELASIIYGIKNSLHKKDKEPGLIKIEACLSSLSRKIDRKEESSLVDEVKKQLNEQYGVDDVVIKGNPGNAMGTNYGTGVQVTCPWSTDAFLLFVILNDIEEYYDSEKNKFGSFIANFKKPDKIIKLIKDGIGLVKKIKDTHLKDKDFQQWCNSREFKNEFWERLNQMLERGINNPFACGKTIKNTRMQWGLLATGLKRMNNTIDDGWNLKVINVPKTHND